ncbi:MAG: helicase [Cryomorphaceae bacterium]|nr:MAG: helicase [Cryomorphaceae bacterium]
MLTDQTTTTNQIELAAQMVNTTGRHLFLTGKAGTGKTTFLRDLAHATHKNFVIVAPTGVAALNAGGVTIHSQFLLPPGNFLPGNDSAFSGELQAAFYTRKSLAYKHPLNQVRKKVLRNIDLLIIDEVSMLRADLLDAMDYRLRSARGRHREPFGGVQLLMIGDLYQLPPIVRDHEWSVLRQYYPAMYFYESHALKESGYAYIELNKVFRQQDDDFLHILNRLRNNQCTADDLALLNQHYQKDYQSEQGVVTLTTHNATADAINRQEMNRLPGKTFSYYADVRDDFPESLHPLPEKLEFKEGAQVMFIRNDPEGQAYYNGKLARITHLDSDEIRVAMEDDDDFVLTPHVWKNTRYSVDEKSQELTEDVVGTFTQFPIKPAWAITVHKSQGLTFEKAVIDVGKAFAPGQVYVALSRLRSLDGLVLRTPVSPSVISSDQQVVRYTRAQAEQPPAAQSLLAEQHRYLSTWLTQAFDWSDVLNQVAEVQQKAGAKMEFEDEEMRTALQRISEAFRKEQDNARIFRNQLHNLMARGDHEKLLERVDKGSAYYRQLLEAQLYALWVHTTEVDMLAKTKTYVKALGEVDQLLYRKMAQLDTAVHLCDCILKGRPVEKDEQREAQRQQRRAEIQQAAAEHVRRNPKNLSTKTGRKRKTGETYQVSYALFREGLDAEGVAKERGMAISTIEGHLARGIEEGELSIEPYISPEELQTINAAFDAAKDPSLNAVRADLNNKYSFGKLRMVQAWRGKRE